MVFAFHESTLLQLGVQIILGQRIFSYIYIYIYIFFFPNVWLFHSLVMKNHPSSLCTFLYTVANKYKLLCKNIEI